MNTNDRTDGELARDACERSFRAACRVSTNQGMPTNAATLSGFLLFLFGSASQALEAIADAPPGEVWNQTREYLEIVARDERADTQRPQAAAGGVRR